MNIATAAESGVVLVLIGIALPRLDRDGVRRGMVDREQAYGAVTPDQQRERDAWDTIAIRRAAQESHEKSAWRRVPPHATWP